MPDVCLLSQSFPKHFTMNFTFYELTHQNKQIMPYIRDIPTYAQDSNNFSQTFTIVTISIGIRNNYVYSLALNLTNLILHQQSLHQNRNPIDYLPLPHQSYTQLYFRQFPRKNRIVIQVLHDFLYFLIG